MIQYKYHFFRRLSSLYTGKYFIEKLNMKEHPEGGYYNECLKSKDLVDANAIDKSFDGERKLWTSIYFLLKDRDVSRLHRLKSDEIWYYHSGVPMVIHIINKNGELERVKLGLDIERGEKPQVLIPKGSIFGAIMDGTGYSLAGCMVSPGFEFGDFELLEREDLIRQYPQYELIIKRLTK